VLFRWLSNARTNNALALLGLALIAYAIAPYPPLDPVVPVLPCAGAALIIHAGSRSSPLVNLALSTKVPVFIGLISYSLYLWHWPLYVFATYRLARGLSAAETAGLIALSIAIAALSWRFVEQPFRRPDGVVRRPQLFRRSAALMSVLGLSGVAIWATDGAPQRLHAGDPDRARPADIFQALGVRA
jgi:peptidoglycan/LPS O-acetylase OafA/YrhL